MKKDIIDKIVNAEEFIDDIEIQDILSLIHGQIKNPFETNENYLEKLLDRIADEDLAQDICRSILEEIFSRNVYMHIRLDEMDNIKAVTKSIYKFFIKNREKLTYIFIKEYIMKNKTRKKAIHGLKSSPGYNKIYHAKKDYYLLITKMPKVVKNIRDLNLDFDDFIKFLSRSYDKGFTNFIKNLYDSGTLTFTNYGYNFLDQCIDSNNVESIYTKLIKDVNNELILPKIDNIKPNQLLYEPEIEDHETEEDDSELREIIV